VRKERQREKYYHYDHVFKDTCSQLEVFKTCVEPKIDPVLKGTNATIFAYGATSAGKTFTMMGTSKEPGIMYLTLQSLFKKLAVKSPGAFSVSISYLEIYNEKIRDLLTGQAEGLEILEDPIRGVNVYGITYVSVENAKSIMSLLTKGNRNRTQKYTGANDRSSRSHAVLQVNVSYHPRGKKIKLSKLSLIDLAGSERAAETMNSGMRMIEGANINRSLLALSNCINSLIEPKNEYVNYRDSKLTRLLKDSLVGNCQTVMIANISPSVANYEETLNTLKYASRAKFIKQRPSPLSSEISNVCTGENSLNGSTRTISRENTNTDFMKQNSHISIDTLLPSAIENLEKLFLKQLDVKNKQLDFQEKAIFTLREIKKLEFNIYQCENQMKQSEHEIFVKDFEKNLEKLKVQLEESKRQHKDHQLQIDTLGEELIELEKDIYQVQKCSDFLDATEEKYAAALIKAHFLEMKSRIDCNIDLGHAVQHALLTSIANQREAQIKYSNQIISEYLKITSLQRSQIKSCSIDMPEQIIRVEKSLYKMLTKLNELSVDVIDLQQVKPLKSYEKNKGTLNRIKSVLNFHRFITKKEGLVGVEQSGGQDDPPAEFKTVAGKLRTREKNPFKPIKVVKNPK
jgi:hypothetical protein